QLEPAVSDYESYRGRLLTDESAEVFKTELLKGEPDGTVMVSLPTELLTAGDYRLKLDGIRQGTTESAGAYHFSIASK
ncbi:MAG TPA: hypothetical protein VF527_09905, partial [Pyrinomonadaceae bacterium]